MKCIEALYHFEIILLEAESSWKFARRQFLVFWGLQLELNRLTSFFFVPHSLEPLLRESADVAPRGYFFNSCCELCDLNFVSCARNPCFSMPYFIKTLFWMTFVMFLTMDWCQKCKLCAISCDLRFVLEMTIQCNPAQSERVLCCALTIVNIFFVYLFQQETEWALVFCSKQFFPFGNIKKILSRELFLFFDIIFLFYSICIKSFKKRSWTFLEV